MEDIFLLDVIYGTIVMFSFLSACLYLSYTIIVRKKLRRFAKLWTGIASILVLLTVVINWNLQVEMSLKIHAIQVLFIATALLLSSVAAFQNLTQTNTTAIKMCASVRTYIDRHDHIKLGKRKP